MLYLKFVLTGQIGQYKTLEKIINTECITSSRNPGNSIQNGIPTQVNVAKEYKLLVHDS